MIRHYYLAQPYPDELIGSTLIRSARHRGLPLKSFWTFFSGRRPSGCPMMLSAHLGVLSDAMGVSAVELLYRHTVFPYATAFMSAVETARLARNVIELNGQSQKVLVQSAIAGSAMLRYCEHCVQDDLRNFGEAYWHRSHNLPHVELCYLHRAPLKGRKQQLVTQELPAECSGEQTRRQLSPEVSLELSNLSAALLNTRERRDISEWAHHYRERATVRGLAWRINGFDTSSLVAEFESYYGAEFLKAWGLEVKRTSSAWPALLLRVGCSRPAVTSRHLLFQIFLNNYIQPTQREVKLSGGRCRDLGHLDAALAKNISRLLSELPNGKRITVPELLSKAGAWQAFRHHRPNLPKTGSMVNYFKSSDFAVRQTGGRQRKGTSPTNATRGE